MRPVAMVIPRPAAAAALERRDERGVERQGMIDERAVEIADEELVAHALSRMLTEPQDSAFC